MQQLSIQIGIIIFSLTQDAVTIAQILVTTNNAMNYFKYNGIATRTGP